MKVFKFGGASLRNAAAIRNMAGIVQIHSTTPLLVVVSAMGKTTNALEQMLYLYKHSDNWINEVNTLKQYHETIIQELMKQPSGAMVELENLFKQLVIEIQKPGEEDDVYDRIIVYGEIISSKIVSGYFREINLNHTWKDSRQYIVTDSSFREGKVDWEKTETNVKKLKAELDESIILTQGFIGATPEGHTTTLGREGSDYSAAIFGSCLEADQVTIWKDVPGVMNADPKRLPAAIVFDELPYKEAAEMTYYGASVIHPKTIKPLALKQIPLYVKSFDDPTLPGTKIHECHVDQLPPLIVFKDNQCLISCKVTDYTFVNEQQLSTVFNALSELDIKINVMQNSAISFSFCIDFRENKVMSLIEKLQHHFEVYYNTNLTLITVKNYDEQSFNTYRKRPGVMIEQSSRSTLQVLVKN